MPFGLQHVIVTLVAAGATGVFARRMFGWGRPRKAACPSCESGTPCEPRAETTAGPEVRPLVLVRKSGPGPRAQGPRT
jgi:hypothetical protein